MYNNNSRGFNSYTGITGSISLVAWLAILLLMLSTSVWVKADQTFAQEKPQNERQSKTEKTLNRAGKIIGHTFKSFVIEPLRSPITSVKELSLFTLYGVTDLVTSSYNDYIRTPLLQNSRKAPRKFNAGDKPWEQIMEESLHLTSTQGNMDFMIDGDRFFSRLIEAIENAEHSIEIRTYIFDNDDYALQIAELLKRRSQDVEVRIIMDGLGTLSGIAVDSHSAPAEYVPPTSINRFLKRDSNIKTRFLANPWFTGDHTKTIVIDNRLAFLGGMNIGREYRYDWHDMMIELTGPVVTLISRDFERAWKHSSLGDLAMLIPDKKYQTKAVDGDFKEIQLLYTRIENPQIYRAQLAAIRRARDYIYIENAYFSDDLIVTELIRARQRGVDVRVIIPSRGDNSAMDRSNALTINTLIRNNIRTYIYPGMSHVKAAVYDGWACLGTANFDKMSLKINKELNVGTSDPETVQRLITELFEKDFALSREVIDPQPTRPSDHIYEMVADLIL